MAVKTAALNLKTQRSIQNRNARFKTVAKVVKTFGFHHASRQLRLPRLIPRDYEIDAAWDGSSSVGDFTAKRLLVEQLGLFAEKLSSTARDTAMEVALRLEKGLGYH